MHDNAESKHIDTIMLVLSTIATINVINAEAAPTFTYGDVFVAYAYRKQKTNL